MKATTTPRQPDPPFTTMVGENRVTLLHNGDQCFPAMLSAIKNAKTEILLEMYWFASDLIGTRFAELLSEKAREGVTVKVIYDAVGSLSSDSAMWERMEQAGCRVHQFHPIAPWRRRFNFSAINRRDHRKILVIDSEVGFTGGVNVGDEWASVEDDGQGWRDDVVRVEGPDARQLEMVFSHTWNKLTREPKRKTAPMPHQRVWALANHTFGERRAIRKAYLTRINKARRRIFLTNSYFVPGKKIRNALMAAAARGVEVRVVIPRSTDVTAVFYASSRLYEGLMEAGVSIHLWEGPTLHAKTATIDDTWCNVGTYNLDSRSFRYNLEVAMSFEDVGVATALSDQFRRDLLSSPLLNLRNFRFRPMGQRFLEHFFYMFRRLL